MAVDQAFIIKKLQELDLLYAAYSQATRMPFATCDKETYNDQVHVFTEETDIQAFAKEYTEKKVLLMGVKVTKNQFPTFYMNLFAMGINEVVFYTEGKEHKLALTDIVKKPDYEHIPVEKRPLLNPSLQLSVAYFLQKLRRPGVEQDKKELHELEDEVSANLAKSEFIMPVDINPEKEENDPKRYLLPYVKNKQGKCFQPVLSDTGEVIKHNKRLQGDGRKHEYMKIPFGKLAAYMTPNSDGFIINPDGYALTINKEQMEIIVKYYGKEEKNTAKEKEEKTEE